MVIDNMKEPLTLKTFQDLKLNNNQIHVYLLMFRSNQLVLLYKNN